ncbi:WSC domain-containing protein [Neurospora tetraspora]|uniref:WSC domain-containing protein n=1 Tax=Neurospora tetraspora TaxID=94610 RepID=A0AAE0MW55_9PEZI|nr:WSC domain-containing protein [Neurospora tetraspora]
MAVWGSTPSFSCVRRTCFIYIFLSWFIAVNLAAAAAPETTSTSSPATATIAPGTNGYKYIGCYNETTALSGTGSGTRALYGGINEVLPGEMTVEKCLGFCKSGMKEEKGYRFAGLEYSRECWCATQLFSLSSKVANTECNLACDGNKSQICGGDLRISVYDLHGVVNSVAADGQSTPRLALMLVVLVVGGGVVGGLL